MIETMTITTSAYKPTYCFQIELSDIELDRLKHKTLLGGFVRLQKSEWEFLNDLRNIIADELMVRFKEMIDKEQAK